MKALVGLVLVAAHAIAFVQVVPSCRRPELALALEGSAVGAEVEHLPPELEARVERAGTPGLRYTRYVTAYRGGFERSAGIARLEGPRQDPGVVACTGRVVVGQKLLDDGTAGPGTIAGEMARNIAAELAGESITGIGDFERVEAVSLRWAELAKHPEDLLLVGVAPHGYVRATATLVFERVNIPLVVTLVPRPSARELAFKVTARAELDLGNRVLQWMSDKLGGDKLATRFARREIDRSLITALAPPPPFDLPDGQQLGFTYCDGPPEIREGVSGALPFAVVFAPHPGAPHVLPPRAGAAPHAPLSPGATLAIDLDLDGANALLHELWRTGFLDRRLAAAGLDRRFNEDPIVTEYLTLRISPPRLALPPALGVRGDRLQLFADARVTIADGEAQTIGRVWGGLEFAFARQGVEPVGVDLGALELTCERGRTLVPCYADLVGALRDRGPEFHGELTRTFAQLLEEIFVDQRVGASGLSADLVIRAARPWLVSDGANGSLHIELDGQLVPKR